jgi:hypothetical protein
VRNNMRGLRASGRETPAFAKSIFLSILWIWQGLADSSAPHRSL